MRDIFTDESVRLAVGLDGWILDIARDKWAVDEEMTMDEIFKVYTEFIAKHWHLQPHEVTYSDLLTVKRKICQLFSITDSLSKVGLDWNFDDDNNYRYKFDIERRKHSLEKGMWILLSVGGSLQGADGHHHGGTARWYHHTGRWLRRYKRRIFYYEN